MIWSTPRRICVDKMTPAELAIRNAVLAVEALGADVRLTAAVIKLAEANNLVADVVDEELSLKGREVSSEDVEHELGLTKKHHHPKGHPHMQPTTPTLISYINQSTKLSDAEVAAAVPAFGAQLAEDYAPVWGLAPGVEFCPRGTTPNGNVKAFVVDEVPEAPGALAYHDVDRDGTVTGTKGQAYIKVAVIDGYDWRTSASHENLELCADYAANKYADDGGGKRAMALEVCDTVESRSYPKKDGNGQDAPMSDFVYPAYFNPWANAVDKLDHMEILKHPFSLDAQSYAIWMVEGDVTQQMATHAEAGHDVHHVLAADQSRTGRHVVVVFSRDYPPEKKAAKLTKVGLRFSRPS